MSYHGQGIVLTEPQSIHKKLYGVWFNNMLWVEGLTTNVENDWHGGCKRVHSQCMPKEYRFYTAYMNLILLFDDDKTVARTLYAAKKYMVDPLAEACIQYLKLNLNAENIFPAIQIVELYSDINGFLAFYWEKLRQLAEEVAESLGFSVATIQISLLLYGRA